MRTKKEIEEMLIKKQSTVDNIEYKQGYSSIVRELTNEIHLLKWVLGEV